MLTNLVYVNDVINNDEVIERVKNDEYKRQQKNTYSHLEAIPLDSVPFEATTIELILHSYAKNQGLELLMSEPKYSTSLVNFDEYKAIAIEEGLFHEGKEEERLVSLAHELGHYLDVKFNHAGDAFRFNAVYHQDNWNTVRMELVAWIYGRNILKAFGYDNDNFFIKQMLFCLGTYVGNKEDTVKVIKNWKNVVSEYEQECKKVLEMIVH